MKKPKLVSIITPAFNCGDYIAETIDSLIKQDYENWECFIVDDFSTDTTAKIVQAYQEKDIRINLVQSSCNSGGPAKPRNMGLELSKGEYIAFVDSDDVWEIDKLSKQVAFLDANQAVDGCWTEAKIINESSQVIGAFVSDSKWQRYKNFILLKMFGGLRHWLSNVVNINSLVVRHDALNNVSFDTDKRLVALEDWYFCIQLFKQRNLVKINQQLIRYRVHSASISRHGSDLSRRKSIYMYARALVDGEVSFAFFVLLVIKQIIFIGASKFLYLFR